MSGSSQPAPTPHADEQAFSGDERLPTRTDWLAERSSDHVTDPWALLRSHESRVKTLRYHRVGERIEEAGGLLIRQVGTCGQNSRARAKHRRWTWWWQPDPNVVRGV